MSFMELVILQSWILMGDGRNFISDLSLLSIFSTSEYPAKSWYTAYDKSNINEFSHGNKIPQYNLGITWNEHYIFFWKLHLRQ